MINSSIFKLELIQTLPGKEISVAQKLHEACAVYARKEYLLLKALGGFDIIFLYKTDDFGFSLTRFGPIEGILKYNQLLCYSIGHEISLSQWGDQSRPAHGVSIVKLRTNHNSTPRQTVTEKYNIFSGLHPQDGDSSVVLGTLGWSDYIVLSRNTSLTRLYSDIASFGCVESQGNVGKHIIKKTISYAGVPYESLFGKDWSLAGSEKIRQEPRSEAHQLKETILESTSVTISVSLSPINTASVKRFWLDRNYDVSDTIGQYDLIVKNGSGATKTWAALLFDLLIFRDDYAKSIVQTCTKIDISSGPVAVDSQVEDNEEIDYLEVPFEEARKLFGDEVASILSSKLYSINSLMQHPVNGDAYADVAQYTEYMLEAAVGYVRENRNTETFALTAVDALDYGTELRSYGTFGQLESYVSKFTKIKGGVHKSLGALQLMPQAVLARIGNPSISWKGFVNAWDSKFFHINEILFVPIDSLWNPLKWWPIYHEIGHVMIHKDILDIMRPRSPEILGFMVDKSYQHLWYKLLEELVAEVIGYELCFFGDYNLYQAQLWKYIKNVSKICETDFSWTVYLVRSFFVELWSKLSQSCSSHKGFTELYNNAVSQEVTLFQMFLEHIHNVEILLSIQIENKNFIAASQIYLFKSLCPFASALYKDLFDLNVGANRSLLPNQSWLEDENTVEFMSYIGANKIFDKPIIYPEAGLHLLNKIYGESMEFNTALAVVLSFYNSYIIWGADNA